MATLTSAAVRPSRRGGKTARQSSLPATGRTNGEPFGSQATSGQKVTSEQATEFVVIHDGEVVYRSSDFGRVYAFREGFGRGDTSIAQVLCQPGQQLPDDQGDETGNHSGR